MFKHLKTTALATFFVTSPLLITPVLAECLDINLRKNMSYHKGKQILLDNGWQHNSLPAYGYNEESEKVQQECHGSVEICNEYPEIESCSSTGYCLMEFYDHFGNKLHITTYGPLLDPQLHIIGWRVVPNQN